MWAGHVSGDTFAPLRALMSGTSRTPTAHRSPRRTPRGRTYRMPRAALPTRTGPPTVAGRWSLLPQPEPDATVRAHATADLLLDRYGVVTRGSVVVEEVPGGFSQMYRVLTGFEDAGRCRRGYFVNGLGGAQFATSDVVDRLRAGEDERREQTAVALAATDPANPYGAALPWPGTDGGHRPGRKAGALVVLVDGELVLYVERGGRSLLSFVTDEAILTHATEALAALVKHRRVESILVEKVDGEAVHTASLAPLLTAAGFSPTPRGLRLRRV